MSRRAQRNHHAFFARKTTRRTPGAHATGSRSVRCRRHAADFTAVRQAREVASPSFYIAASAQSALKSGPAQAQVPLPAHDILPHSALVGLLPLSSRTPSQSFSGRSLGLRDSYPYSNFCRCPLYGRYTMCTVILNTVRASAPVCHNHSHNHN
jgi:hypothetical protein